MGEVLGVVGGIVGILGLTIQVSQIASKFGSDWKHAPEDLKGFVEEVKVLHKTLAATCNLAVDPEFLEAFKGQESLLESTTDTSLLVEECAQKLQEFLNKFNTGGKNALGRGLDRLKNALRASDIRDTVTSLDRACRKLNDTVNIDAARLVSKLVVQSRKTDAAQQQWREDQEAQRILAWLSNLDFGNKHDDILAKCCSGTGHWILGHNDFIRWMDGAEDTSKILWCPGIPGAGKTVTTSIVIDHIRSRLENQPGIVTYVYCDYADSANQTTLNLITSILKQAVLQLSSLPHISREAYKSHSSGTLKLSLSEAVELFHDVVSDLRTSPLKFQLFVVIDALDEFNYEPDASPLVFLDRIRDLMGQSGLIFVTSRGHVDVRQHVPDCVRIDIQATPEDITTFVNSELSNAASFKKSVFQAIQSRDDLKTRIIEKLVANSQGMFLLPQLQVNHLSNQNNIRDLTKALESLPRGIDETYDKAMERVMAQAPEDRELGLQALKWISNTPTPLSILQLRHALAIDPKEDNIDDDALSAVEDIMSASAGLLGVDKESDTIRLVHFTAKQYFEKTSHSWFPGAHIHIATACIDYLCMKTLNSSDSWHSLRTLFDPYPLFKYALGEFGNYLKKGLRPENIAAALTSIDRLQSSPQALRAIPFHTSGYDGYFSCSKSRKAIAPRQSPHDLRLSSAHIAMIFGLHEIISLICETDASASSSVDWLGTTPLEMASWKGDEQSIRLLIKNYVDLNKPGGEGRNPLYYVASNPSMLPNSARLVKILLDAGADANSKYGPYGESPLHLVSSDPGDQLESAIILVRHGAEVSSRGPRGRTPLMNAIINRNFKIVELLLAKGAVVDDQDDELSSVLMLAASHGTIETLQMLIKKGAPIDLIDRRGRNVLYYTSPGHGNEVEVLKFLLSQGAKANERDRKGFSALMYHINRPGTAFNEKVASLVGKGADVNAADSRGNTVLMLVARIRRNHLFYLEALHLIMSKGARIEDRNDKGMTALMFAARGQEAQMPELLLEYGACYDAKDHSGMTALMHAARSNNVDTCALLIRKGANVTERDTQGMTALLYAAKRRHSDMASLLLGNGSRIDEKDDEAKTALIYATLRGRLEMIEFFLAHGAKVDETDNWGKSALMYAIESSLLGTDGLKLLLGDGGHLNNVDNTGKSALIYAVMASSLEQVQFLISGGAQINLKDDLGKTSLMHAAGSRNVDLGRVGLERLLGIVQLLVQKGAQINVMSTEGKSAADYAADVGNIKIVEFLNSCW